ncbi:MAG: YlmC/YmxH family sporulation protein [Bacilli bacterium]|nr:YlmC/YmxH family sporulation protein [Bacilli bacterium]
MNLSELQNKDIISVNNGKKIGNIIDVIIDEKGNLKTLIVQKTKFFWNFFNNSEFEINWQQIDKIGEDVILINLEL